MSEINEIDEIINNVFNFKECDKEYECEICLFLNISPYMFVPCGHTVCKKCSDKIKICPFCRSRIERKVKNYALKIIMEKNNIGYTENVKKFVSFFEPIFSSNINIGSLLKDERLAKNLNERILTIEKIFKLEKDKRIDIIGRGGNYRIYKLNDYYFVSYDDILMVDIDGDYSIEEVKEELYKTNESFVIYKSKNGYHAFMVSKRINFNDKDILKLMCSINLCNEKYTLFTWLSKKTTVRINRKYDESYRGRKLYKYVCHVGKDRVPNITKDIMLHNTFTICYADKQITNREFVNKIAFLYDDMIHVEGLSNYKYADTDDVICIDDDEDEDRDGDRDGDEYED
jgi:hypothetical protein